MQPTKNKPDTTPFVSAISMAPRLELAVPLKINLILLLLSPTHAREGNYTCTTAINKPVIVSSKARRITIPRMFKVLVEADGNHVV